MDFVEQWECCCDAKEPVSSQPTVLVVEFIWELGNFCREGVWIFHWSPNWFSSVSHFS